MLKVASCRVLRCRLSRDLKKIAQKWGDSSRADEAEANHDRGVALKAAEGIPDDGDEDSGGCGVSGSGEV